MIWNTWTPLLCIIGVYLFASIAIWFDDYVNSMDYKMKKIKRLQKQGEFYRAGLLIARIEKEEAIDKKWKEFVKQMEEKGGKK